MVMHKICGGADPFVFRHEDRWHLLLQDSIDSHPLAHDGIRGYSVRSADRIEDLPKSLPIYLQVSSQRDGLRQVWAGEIHSNYLYVSASNGNNTTHRIHVYKTNGEVHGPWEYLGELKTAVNEDGWMIDLTFGNIVDDENNERTFAFWSGWEQTPSPDSNSLEIVPQQIYVAECITPTEIGPRHLIAAPEGAWACSIASILEGPQALYIDEKFKGLILSGNASWTKSYATKVLHYLGGNPCSQNSWKMADSLLFPKGKGIGHGVIVEQANQLYFIGHYKTNDDHGWEDREVFFTQLTPDCVHKKI